MFIFALCICSVIRLVYLRSVYLFCHSTCLSSLCVFILSFDLFIFALCICSVIRLVCLRNKYTERRQTSRMTEQIHRAKINKSNDRTNTQSEDKQVGNLTCLSSFCVFGLSFDLFIFVLCICSVIWLVYLRSVYLFCNFTCLTQNEDKQVKWQTIYTERR
jgi:hypothetical protein